MPEVAIRPKWAEAAPKSSAFRCLFCRFDVTEVAVWICTFSKLRKVRTLWHKSFLVFVQVQAVTSVSAGTAKPVPTNLKLNLAKVRNHMALWAISPKFALTRLIVLAHFVTFSLLCSIVRQRIFEVESNVTRVVHEHSLFLDTVTTRYIEIIITIENKSHQVHFKNGEKLSDGKLVIEL